MLQSRGDSSVAELSAEQTGREKPVAPPPQKPADVEAEQTNCQVNIKTGHLAAAELVNETPRCSLMRTLTSNTAHRSLMADGQVAFG